MAYAWKLIVALLLVASIGRAEEITVKSRFVSLGLFKNGLAVVRKSVSIPGPGTYRILDVPEPVYGTFWMEAGAGVEARMTTEVVDSPIQGGAGIDFQEELVGCEVMIYFRDGGIPPAAGKVVSVENPKGADAWNRTYQTSRYDSFGNASQPPSPGHFLVLDGPDGRTYIDTSMIAYLRTKSGKSVVKQRKPVLLLTVPKAVGAPAEIFFLYLAQGASWAPGYRVDISSPDQLVLEQNAVVKNELDDFEDAEISLISGFPSVEFAHVTSPFSLRTTWAQFFQQLNQRMNPGSPTTLNSPIRQVVTNNTLSTSGGLDLTATPSGDGVDLHYQSLGKRTLSEGDSLTVNTASGKTPYKRIVEWIVPDNRDASGRIIDEYRRQMEPDKYQDTAWDAVRFKNPLPFPMTTAPAVIFSNGRFNGQRMATWVNSGEETTLSITKALSLRTYHAEQEEPDSREIVYVGGNDYRKVAVKGELRINNHRKETISLAIRRRFSGDLTDADGSPRCDLLEEGVYSVNKRNELIWTLELKSGEEKTLTYRYSVLVDN